MMTVDASDARERRQPQSIDKHVGGRIRKRRRQLRISQSLLAAALGLSFQQVQKYERGSNRISASKLFDAALFLHIPIAYFFEGLTSDADNDATWNGNLIPEPDHEDLARYFPKIRSQILRQQLAALVKRLALEASNP